jgi:hypothetical protein
LFGWCQGAIDLDFEIPDRAFDLGMTVDKASDEQYQPGPKKTWKEIHMSNVIVVIGAGLIVRRFARRVSVGKHVLLADLRSENAEAAATSYSRWSR